MHTTITTVILVCLALSGIFVAIYVVCRRNRPVQLRERSISQNFRRIIVMRGRPQHPEALPHKTPSYPNVVDAYAIVPKSQMKRLQKPSTTQLRRGEREGDEVTEVDSVFGVREGQQQQHHENEYEQEPDSALPYGNSSTASRNNRGARITEGPEGASVSYYPPHISKAASIHGGSVFMESITLLRRLSSRIIFGRAAYETRESQGEDGGGKW